MDEIMLFKKKKDKGMCTCNSGWRCPGWEEAGRDGGAIWLDRLSRSGPVFGVVGVQVVLTL